MLGESPKKNPRIKLEIEGKKTEEDKQKKKCC